MSEEIKKPSIPQATNPLPSREDAQAKNAILTFLSELGIQKIVYVDDRCSIQELKEAYIGKLKALYESKPLELGFVNWSSPTPIFEKEIVAKWEDSSEDEKRQLFLSILEFENNQEELENSVAPLKLKAVLKEKIDLLSPTDWISKKDGLINTLKSNSKILFLFDIEFKHAPLPDGRDGRDLAAELLGNDEIEEFVHCGIFSHLFDIVSEHDKRNEYCKSHGLAREKFYTISKKRFDQNSYLPGLAEGIRNSLLINEVELLKKGASSIIKKSFRNSLKEIDDLSPSSFNHIIQRSSKNEGVWEMATLFRLTDIITSEGALNALLPSQKRTKINENLEKIRKVEKIKTGGVTPLDKTHVQRLRKKELYLPSTILNKLHFPISNGDIFSIEEKEYILLAQPCNLALRKNGERDRNYDIGFLICLETISSEIFNKYKKGQLSTFELIEDTGLEIDKVKLARFSNFRTVSLSPLDLTVFNTNGMATIDLGKTAHESMTIQESWKKRYKYLHTDFTEFAKGISTFKKLRSLDKVELEKMVYYGTLFNGYDIKNEKSLSRSGKKLTFNITRIAHYKAPFSADLLQKFMQYLSRNAFDHDFSN
ncbi:hypothetical protein C9994_00080 [Marivirga lumbricoides]|uniref:Uncharacterized protein n=1 Tax=Marivirga lumbricoides TaxID=1046115 RepID=A0A2T4DW16_9BACT|nr:hypothetical protein C9994_00080 [Marivirga lumbricoides]